MLDEFHNLHLDTTMLLADYFDPPRIDAGALESHSTRILYGTDFPNIPYEWDRELAGCARSR